MNVRKQKELIEELMQTALIVRDFESRYNLSLELLKLNAVEPMPEETIMKIRQKYKLNSAVWIKAELTVQEGTENEELENQNKDSCYSFGRGQDSVRKQKEKITQERQKL